MPSPLVAPLSRDGSFAVGTLLGSILIAFVLGPPLKLVAPASWLGGSRTDSCAAVGMEAFAGAFGAGSRAGSAVVDFTVRRGDLLMTPVLWDGALLLERSSGDSFFAREYPPFAAAFQRGADGCPDRVVIRGLPDSGPYQRLEASQRWPVQLLREGRAREAGQLWHRLTPGATDTFATVARQLFLSRPSHAVTTEQFLREMIRLEQTGAALHGILGDVLVAEGRRAAAYPEYRQALALDPENEDAIAGLELLGSRRTPVDSGWRLSFSVHPLLRPPEAREIDQVWRRWSHRDLRGDSAAVVLVRSINLDGVPAEARVVRYLVQGVKTFGVIIVPEALRGRPAPILLEAKGVSWNYSPLRIPQSLTSPFVLGADRARVIYVAPGYRGERIVIGDDTLQSDGDRTDAWDGATDDLLALLSVAPKIVPQADTTRVCVFGRSRGGTVALLAGIRDHRIGCVVSWAAPTDWFRLMGQGGWTEEELLRYGLDHRSTPANPLGGQYIDHFLTRAIRGQADLGETRLHLLASSPLYFAARLPMTQVHWGLDDAMVPVVNGRAFVERFRHYPRNHVCLDVHFHPDAGHDQDRQLAPLESHQFLNAGLFGDRRTFVACRTESGNRNTPGRP
jgi:hypothetical protein